MNAVDPTGMQAAATFAGKLIKQAYDGSGDMWSNYNEMKDANTIGADKYYHCKGNCEATKRGPGGRAAAWSISAIREGYGQIKGDPASDMFDDFEANGHGRDVRNDEGAVLAN